MEGEYILNSIINKSLEKGKIQSFVLNGKLVDRINVTFLKFDKWIRIVSSEENINVEIENQPIDTIESFGDNDFNYPIEKIDTYYSDFKKYIGLKLVSWKELVWEKDNNLTLE